MMNDLLELIMTRRTIGKVKDDPVPREDIEKILEAGNWAPSHFNTQPWKYFVITGNGRKRLGEAYAKIALLEKGEGLTDAETKALYEKSMNKAFRAPLVIAVACLPHEEEYVVEAEEFAAVAASIQNMLLAAHALGYGAIWRTGAPSYHPVMKELFGLGAKDRLMGLVYIGRPDMVRESRRIPVEQKTEWWS
ncbi:nitroreductase [Aneurinibacillus thermoaerophilus]|uniref:Putative NAD(P)H nitroreductase n=2 Tax=Aneurinibacillus thermoaerophilus TaxID=143495 RepID=A0ABX8YDW5_ANETH|nr:MULTISPECIES: nitroreductase [Aneurinibacillus]MED0679328.1 nitroreductase [Aneurinibacillus thermoaerophilus]MED0756521.1 nitroreductase [Aneurinibacillus thermoaerophilus]MED0761080.1 nitroreductase [Aneurinibacillus thermoaerophilus]MED0764482.1 nitroreductase [Aneurinibacillus thermoaerophilus]QYY43580.1 nitroreductase [Aneurinibacillus thermoaerophilus]